MAVWQTTNQQPWVHALTTGLITVKTRMSWPVVPIGSKVLLHASKELWRHWRGLKWCEEWDMKAIPKGVVEAVATVEAVGPTEEIMTKKERRYWDVDYIARNGEWIAYDSPATYSIRFCEIIPLKKLVAVKGFQAPFAKAKADTIRRVCRANPEIVGYLKA